MALNRAEIHPVETLFGSMRVAANHNHSWDRCKGTLVKAALMNEILFTHHIKCHVRRDYTIARVKVMDSPGQNIFFIHGYGDRGIAHTERTSSFVLHPASTTQPDALAPSIDDLHLPHEWQNAGYETRLYSPGRIVSKTKMVRMIGSRSAHSQGGLRWTQRQIQKASQLHDDPNCTIELIASKLGCDPKELRAVRNRSVQNEANPKTESKGRERGGIELRGIVGNLKKSLTVTVEMLHGCQGAPTDI
jgi:hypothetical protein